MSRRARRVSLILALTAVACLDPLYEDGAPLSSGWVLCCNGGALTTCFCADATSCQHSLYACAGGRCSTTPLCSAAGGGAGTGGGGGASGGGGGGLADAGVSGGGGGTPPTFEFCCVNARVTTCSCPQGGCSGGPFTPCPGGACVADTTSAICR